MSKDYTTLPNTFVRRSDRAVEDDAWIKGMLRRSAVGCIATVFEGQPFINSNLFVYDEATHAIYFHTARTGRTRTNVEAAKQACFSVFEMGRLLPAAVALEFSVEYSGVVAFGAVDVVKDEDAALYFLQLLLDKYAPHLHPNVDYRPPIAEELKRTAVFRLRISEWSGKRKAVADDFPGAYAYNPVT